MQEAPTFNRLCSAVGLESFLTGPFRVRLSRSIWSLSCNWYDGINRGDVIHPNNLETN